RLKRKFDVIPALVAGIQRSANATVTRRRRRAKLPVKEFADTWIPGTRPGMTRRWPLKLKFNVIPALVAGIQRSANATVAGRRRRAKPPARALAEPWPPGTSSRSTPRFRWRLKLKFDVIPALVAGIHLPANARVARRRRCAKLPARAFADTWIR